jgi:hypothetical protein
LPQFKIGDHVERIGALVHPPYVQSGVVIRVIPNKDGIDLFTEYEVSFDNNPVVTLFEMQLRLLREGKED